MNIKVPKIAQGYLRATTTPDDSSGGGSESTAQLLIISLSLDGLIKRMLYCPLDVQR
jgi:hypothetical protein